MPLADKLSNFGVFTIFIVTFFHLLRLGKQCSSCFRTKDRCEFLDVHRTYNDVQWVPLNIIPFNRISRLLSYKPEIPKRFLCFPIHYTPFYRIRLMSYPTYYHREIESNFCFLPAIVIMHMHN